MYLVSLGPASPYPRFVQTRRATAAPKIWRKWGGREGGGKKSKGAGLEGEGRVERRLGYSLTPLWMSSIALEVKINGEIRHRTDRTSILDEVDLKCYRIAKDQRHVGCR